MRIVTRNITELIEFLTAIHPDALAAWDSTDLEWGAWNNNQVEAFSEEYDRTRGRLATIYGLSHTNRYAGVAMMDNPIRFESLSDVMS